MPTVADLLYPAHVIEFRSCGDFWWQIAGPKDPTVENMRLKSRMWSPSLEEWGEWDWLLGHDEDGCLPARLVPLAEADADPATRGEL